MSEESTRDTRNLKIAAPTLLSDVDDKQDNLSQVAPSPTSQESDLRLLLLQQQQHHSRDMEELRRELSSFIRTSPYGSVSSRLPDKVPDRTREDRRSSNMFFGTPFRPEHATQHSQIQVLQSEIVYENTLKVCSLEGLGYLSKQIQLITSKYPGREIKQVHMVHPNLRPHVIAAWNSHCHKESQITGIELEDIMLEDWLSLDNSQVQQILIESARPRTRELYSRDLVIFLGKGIPQSPPVNTDNFASLFFAPLMKSLNDMIHLHDLLSEDTATYSNNKAKMPTTGFGTKENPGHVSLWLISLGSQKDSILQWLGRDNLCKFKTLDPAVKYIRKMLLEGRTQSESRLDFDSKLTPIKYDDLRHTQGESYSRQQINAHSTRSAYITPDLSKLRDRSREQPRRSTFASIELEPNQGLEYTDDDTVPIDDSLYYDETDEDCVHEFHDSRDFVTPKTHISSPLPVRDLALSALKDDTSGPRTSIPATFRGYCSELFVLGKCYRQHSGCGFDHSAAGQERCIQSFALLTKRELLQHAKLPPWSAPKNDQQLRPVAPRETGHHYHTPPPMRSFGPSGPPRSYSK